MMVWSRSFFLPMMPTCGTERINLGKQLRRESAQLIRGHLAEVGRGSHALDFTKADRLQQ